MEFAATEGSRDQVTNVLNAMNIFWDGNAIKGYGNMLFKIKN